MWTQGEALDWQFLKRYRDGYHLWVPKNLPSPYGEEPGHDVWTEVPEEGEAQLRGYYALEGDWGAGESQVPRGNDAQIVVVDPELAERSQTTGPGGVATLGAAYGTVDADEDEALDGLALYTYQEADPAGTWRGIFTASDNGGLRSPAWRTHEPVRMITANEVVVEKRAYAIVGRSITDRSARRDALADGIEDAGYVEVLINTEIDDASDAAIAATMRRSHYFHFYGHGASVAGDGAYKCVHWIQIAGSEDLPRNLGVPCSAPWAATLGDWCGRMRHTHMQGCSTAVPCIGAPCFGSVYLPSIADYALEQGAQSSAGARHCLSDSEAVLWMDAFYGYADERDENGKFIRDIWGAIQDATDWMDAEHPGSSYGRVEREGVMVPAIKYIGPRDILIAPR